MKCPIDSTDLQMMERQNIEIDYCPTCRGVWLDRGELDKLIERGSGTSAQPVQRESHSQPYHDYDRQPQGKRKKEGLLGELFDF